MCIRDRPVKILYTREECFYSHRGRHPMRMKYRTGFTRDGKITGVDARTIIDGGASVSYTHLYTLQECFYSHRGRHPMRIKYRTGFTPYVKITGVDARTIIDGGA